MAKQAKVLYQVNNEVVTSLKDVAKLLGVSRVGAKDVEEDGKYADQVILLSAEEVETLEDATTDVEPNVETTEDSEEVEAEATEATEATEESDVSDEEWEDPNPVRLKKEEETEEEPHPMEREEEEPYSALDADVEIDAEEVRNSMPEFESLDELKEFIKDIDTPTLEYYAKGLGLDWKPTEHKNIHRMRIAMAFHNHYFPKKETANKATASKGGKYKDYSTEDLEKLLTDNDIEYKTYDDENIHRMRLVMSAKKHNLLS